MIYFSDVNQDIAYRKTLLKQLEEASDKIDTLRKEGMNHNHYQKYNKIRDMLNEIYYEERQTLNQMED